MLFNFPPIFSALSKRDFARPTIHVTFTDPILVTGTLQIITVQSPYGDVSYDLSGETVNPYQPQ